MNNKGQHKPDSTFSVCPVCLQRIPAGLDLENGQTVMRKSCAEHGNFSVVIWRGEPQRAHWIAETLESSSDDNQDCPTACGLCPGHRQSTCCIQLEVTNRCNLSCRYCLAGAQPSGTQQQMDPPLAKLKEWIADITSRGLTFLQITGGEPTLRDDLPEIVRFAKASGCEYVQLNSNGLRLGRDVSLVRALAEAGLSFVFMQFDGVDDDAHIKLRGRPLFEDKMLAVELCGRYNIGVTLVPTLVPGVNDHAVGDIIRLSIKHSPAVRGVHFQPVSYFGRYPLDPQNKQRMTLPELYQAVFSQASEIVPSGSIVPSRCDHAACGFHGAYVVTPQGLKSLTSKKQSVCIEVPSAERNRQFVGRRWQRPAAPSAGSEPGVNYDKCDLSTLDGFFLRSRTHAFTISAMAFQDALTLDLSRLRQCSLHVYDHGRIVPFCAHHLTPIGCH
jgi:uncharacterized radical SAM superfamily Fe-S cluster-containing enzyme